MRTLRIATWNLENLPVSSAKGDACRAKIKEIQSDVLIITEAPEKFDLEAYGYNCVATTKPAVDLPKTKRWVKIYVKSPVKSEFSQLETLDPERTVCAQGVLWDELVVIVYGTVLPWLGDKRNRVNTSGKDVFLAALDEQSKEWDSLTSGRNSDALFIVAGDFNQDLLEEGHFYGSNDRREALKNALDPAKFQINTGGKNDPIASNAPLNANIDHICVKVPQNRTVKSVSSSAWTLVHDGSRISDHFGVYIDIVMS